MSYIWIYRNKDKVKKKKLARDKLNHDCFTHMTTHDKHLIQLRNDFKSGKAVDLYLTWHTVLTGVSIAFFIGLFSANFPLNSFCLKVATAFYSISLFSNGAFSFFYQQVKYSSVDDYEFSYTLHLVKFFEIFRTIVISTPVIGSIFLVFFFSWIAGVLGVVMLLITCAVFLMASLKGVIDKSKQIKKEGDSFDGSNPVGSEIFRRKYES